MEDLKEKIKARGLELGFDKVLMVEGGGDVYPVFILDFDYTSEVKRITEMGDKVVETITLAEKEGKKKVDVAEHVIQQELARVVFKRLRDWSEADFKQSKEDESTLNLLQQRLKVRSLSANDQRVAEACNQRSHYRMGRLELIGDLLRTLESMGFVDS